MIVPFVDLAAQYRAHRSEIDAAIASVIADTAFVGNLTNKYVRTFEQQFAAYASAGHCVACANGTDALELALKACGIGGGDEVIVPAVTWIATSEAVTNVGAVPVFVDIDDATYTMSPEAAGIAVTPRTRAIIPVHLYGLMADMDPILALATRHNLAVIEDCAQAHGASYKGRRAGTLGIAGTFSFFPGKNLGAYGDAGGIVTNDAGLAQRARMYAQHGQAGEKHDHRVEGRNSRMDGLQAAILSAKLPHLDAWTASRRALAAHYDALLNQSGVRRQHVPSDRGHVYHLYTVQVERREEVQHTLQQAGIGTGVHYPRALPTLTAYRHLNLRPADYPAAVRLADSTLSLPMYPEMTDDSLHRVVAELAVATGITSTVV
jgi:dTDP-4-amino-4,6-dideoxygalactose transaminase